jgi:hypothetical protein
LLQVWINIDVNRQLLVAQFGGSCL